MAERDRSSLWDTSKVNSQDWQSTPEILESTKEVGREIESGFNAMETARPIDPETGEAGTFVDFAGVYPRIKPLYRTSSGKKFSP